VRIREKACVDNAENDLNFSDMTLLPRQGQRACKKIFCYRHKATPVPVTALMAVESSSADVEGGKDEFVEWHGEACALEKRRKGNPKIFFV
jgi:hypothetical protein